MIRKFAKDTALLLIDVQKGVHNLAHWGGPGGRMNNPDRENHLRSLLTKSRQAGLPIAFTRHDSLEPDNPLKFSPHSGAQLVELDAEPDDIVVEKSVNSGFIGTSHDLQLRHAGISRLVIARYFTNFCVETTPRIFGNMGFDCYLAHDACATCNRIDLDGTDHDPELVRALSVTNMHGAFCIAITSAQALGLLSKDAAHLTRAQGNEATSQKPELRIARAFKSALYPLPHGACGTRPPTRQSGLGQSLAACPP